MKFRNTFASGLMLTLILAQNVVYAGIPHVAFADQETDVAVVTSDVTSGTQSDQTDTVVDNETETQEVVADSLGNTTEDVADSAATEKLSNTTTVEVDQNQDVTPAIIQDTETPEEQSASTSEVTVDESQTTYVARQGNTTLFGNQLFFFSNPEQNTNQQGIPVMHQIPDDISEIDNQSEQDATSSLSSPNVNIQTSQEITYSLGDTCDHTCFTKIRTSGNGDPQTIGASYNSSEKNIALVASQFGYTIDPIADQLSTERWKLETQDTFAFDVTLLAREALYRHEFGYYTGFDMNTFTVLGKTGTTVSGDAPYLAVGDSVNFTIDNGAQFGFAIKSYEDGVYRGTHATERAANSDNVTIDNALVYRVSDGYIIGFEDLPANGARDNDFNDVVLLVRPTSCGKDDNNGGETDEDRVDLEVKKEASVATTTVGASFAYTISVANYGSKPAENVTVVDILPEGVSFISAEASYGSYDTELGKWFIDLIPVGFIKTLTIVVSADKVGTIVNTATATTDGEIDTNEKDNVDDAVVVVEGDHDNGGDGEENMCLAFVTPFGTDDLLTIGDSFEATEKTLQNILDENGFGSINTETDQKPYEKWHVAQDKSVTFEVTVLGKQSYYEHVFGVYQASDMNTFDALGRTGNIPATTTAPFTTVGQSQIFTVEDGNFFGLAVKAYDPQVGFIQSFATEKDFNIDNHADHAVVFETEEGYIVAFEDLPSTWVADNDYNDLVLYITPISCPDVPDHGDKGIDLSVSKTASVATTTVGTVFDYVVSVTNYGPEGATGVSVTDMLPTGVVFNSATSTVGSYATSTGIWTVGNLTASSTETLTINVTASSTGQISNTATATSTDGKTDNDTNNNSDTVVVTVEGDNNNGGGGDTGIDLSIAKTASVASTTASSTFTYTISVTNGGPETATGVEVTDVLPAGITLDSATTTAGVYTASTSVWTIGALAPSTSETMTLTVTVASGTIGDIVNTATATSTDGKTDNNPDNNSDTVTVTITDGNNGGGGGGDTGIDLSVSKTGSISEVSETDVEFTYIITVTNSGPETATGVGVTDELPASVEFVSATTTAGTYATSTHIWSIDTLANGASETLTIVVKVVSVENDISNTATATSTDGKTDNNPDNNTDTYTVTIPDNNGGGSGSGGGSTSTSGGGGGGNINFVGTGGSGNVDVSSPQCEYLKEFLRYGYDNNPVEVIKLQAFLNSFENESLAVDGFFDLSTDAAVRRFQVKYFGDILEPWGHTDSTGYVYILTKKKVNEIFCNRAFPVTPSEAQEIIDFRAFLESLRARGIDTTGFEGGIGGDMGTDTEIADNTSTSAIRDFFNSIFGNNDEEDEDQVVTTTEETHTFASKLRNLAAAALVLPTNECSASGCTTVLVIILVIIYVLGTLIVNGMSENKPVEVVRSRKLVAFMVGIVIAIIVAILAPYPCIILPLLIILIMLIIWWILRRKKTKPAEMNKEFSL